MKKIVVKNKDKVIPEIIDLPKPLIYANRLAEEYSSQVELQHKKSLGQYFTPINIAIILASFADFKKNKIRILDPGFGTGILSCSLIDRLIKTNDKIEHIILDAYEIDSGLINKSISSLKYLKNWLNIKKIKFDYNLYSKDFIFDNEMLFSEDAMQSGLETKKLYDIVISNPPYFKISLKDERAVVAQNIICGQPNIYSIFMYLAARLLKNDCDLIFIVPRSFTSGEYFRLFRKKFFELVQLKHIHIFESRKNNFLKDDVLQENIIIVAKRSEKVNKESKVIISSSYDATKIFERKEESYQIKDIVDLDSKNKILHIPASEKDIKVINIFKNWKCNLNEYNIQISTGPVVAFRNKQFLNEAKNENDKFVPLYWLHNVKKMKVYWPLNKKGKYEFIDMSEDSKSLLVPNKNYIFLRRFSSKDDQKRLIAAPYYFELGKTNYIGIENHLNYIYRPNGFLDRNEILGLSAILNSDLFDTYFRTFNGNINVSATELRGIPLPSLEDIKELGNLLLLENNFENSNIDEIVNKYFNLTIN